MSLRSKVANTLGPSSLAPVLRKVGPDPLRQDSTEDPFVLGPVYRRYPQSAQASGTYQSYYPVRSWDGSSTTYWALGTYPPAWIYYDFGAASVWRRVGLLHNINNDGRPGSFTVDGSNDASSWTTIASYGSKPPNQTWVRLPITNTTAWRYLRISATNGSEWWALDDTEFLAAGSAPTPSSWLFEDPMTSLSGYTSNGNGTWDVGQGTIGVTGQPPNTADMRLRHSTYTFNSSHSLFIVQVEVKIPAGFATTSDGHPSFGWADSALSNGKVVLAAHGVSGTYTSAMLRQQVAFEYSIPWNFVIGNWYTERVVWDTTNNQFTGLIDGSTAVGLPFIQAKTSLYPQVAVYNGNGTVSGFQFRNLKCWSGALTDVTP